MDYFTDSMVLKKIKQLLNIYEEEKKQCNVIYYALAAVFVVVVVALAAYAVYRFFSPDHLDDLDDSFDTDFDDDFFDDGELANNGTGA